MLQWDTKRGRDFQNIAHLVYCCDGLPVENVPTGYQRIEKWLTRVDPPAQQFKADIEDVLIDLWNMATDEQLNDAFVKVSKQLAPVEFVFIGTRNEFHAASASTDQSSRCIALRFTESNFRATREGYIQPSYWSTCPIQGHTHELKCCGCDVADHWPFEDRPDRASCG